MSLLNFARKRKEQSEGVKAAQVMENEAVKKALDQMEQTVQNMWKNSSDPEERERLWYVLQGQVTFEQYMTTVIATGKASAKELQKEMKRG